ncbi:MAG: hypothetical protein HYV97_16410 [Bdellovibrio sp.]|nr:hypothetical protein [Bdellovibrio sp.]
MFLSEGFISRIIVVMTAIMILFWIARELSNTDHSLEAGNYNTPQMQDRYVAPPTYKVWGRGLVYDCIKGEWACVNRHGYSQCRANMKWNISHNKPYECFTVHVYSSDVDCIVVQLRHITRQVKVDFCNQYQR